MIVQIVDKHMWYLELIKAGCPPRLLPVAFTIMDFVDGQNKSDQYGWAYPTREQIAEIVGKGVTAVSNDTKELADNGWLVKREKSRQGGRKTFYQLAIGKPFNKKVKEYAPAQTAGLMKGRTSVTDDVAPPLTVTSTSVNGDLAPPSLTNDKHKLETTTKTETKTTTPAGPPPPSLDSTEGSISLDSLNVMDKARTTLMKYEQVPGTSVNHDLAQCTAHEKEHCFKPECIKERKDAGQAGIGDEW